jgi:hypothetical protein
MAPMRRLICVLGCLALAAAAQGGPAAAAPRALLDAPRGEDVAVADGEVLVAATTARGGARLTAVPVAGGPARRVLTVRPPGRGWTATSRLASSAQLTALLVTFTDAEGHLRDWRVYTGPPSGPLDLIQHVRFTQVENFWTPLELDVHGDRLLIQEIRFPDPAFRLRVHAPGASAQPLPQGRFGPPSVVAGEDVAYVGLSGRADARSFIRVVDWRTGTLDRSIELGRHSEEMEDRHLDMTDGGRVVAAFDGRLFTGAPGERVHRLSGTRGAPDLSAPRFAGERVAALAEGPLETMRPVVVDPAAGRLRAVGPRSTALDVIAADETTVAWLANGCVLAAGLDGGPPVGAPPPGPCPRAEVVLEDPERDTVLRRRALRVAVTCVAAPPPGCRGAVLLGHDGRVGRRRFRLPAGKRRIVRVALSRRAMSLIRRRAQGPDGAFIRIDARVRNGRVAREQGSSGLVVDRVG